MNLSKQLGYLWFKNALSYFPSASIHVNINIKYLNHANVFENSKIIYKNDIYKRLFIPVLENR